MDERSTHEHGWIHNKPGVGRAACWALLGSLVFFGCSNDAAKWSAFEQCMLGEPLPEGQNVFLTLRGVQLAELQASTPGDAWPGRCAGYAKALHEDLGSSGTAGMVKRSLSEQLEGCDPECIFPKQGPVLPKADELWARARHAKWESKPLADVPKPAAALKVPGVVDYPALAEGYKLVASQFNDEELWLVYRKGATEYRTCRAVGPAASCSDSKSVPELTEGKLSLVRAAARPTLAGLQGTSRRAYDLETGKEVAAFGEEFDEVYNGVGFVQQEQAVDPDTDPTASPLASKFTLHYLKDGVPIARGELKVSARVRGPLVVGDWLVYVERDDELKPRFVARQLAPSGNVAAAKSTEWGGAWPGPMESCSSGELSAVASYVKPIHRIRKDPEPGTTPVTLALHHEGAWLAPIETELPKQVAEFGQLSCGDGWAALPWVDVTPTQMAVRVLRCTPGGCKSEESVIPQANVNGVHGIALLGNTAIVVYRGEGREMLARAGRLEELPDVKPTLLFDNETFGGIEVNAAQFLSGKNSAYFLPDNENPRVLAIGADGSVSAVQAK